MNKKLFFGVLAMVLIIGISVYIYFFGGNNNNAIRQQIEAVEVAELELPQSEEVQEIPDLLLATSTPTIVSGIPSLENCRTAKVKKVLPGEYNGVLAAVLVCPSGDKLDVHCIEQGLPEPYVGQVYIRQDQSEVYKASTNPENYQTLEVHRKRYAQAISETTTLPTPIIEVVTLEVAPILVFQPTEIPRLETETQVFVPEFDSVVNQTQTNIQTLGVVALIAITSIALVWLWQKIIQPRLVG